MIFDEIGLIGYETHYVLKFNSIVTFYWLVRSEYRHKSKYRTIEDAHATVISQCEGFFNVAMIFCLWCG